MSEIHDPDIAGLEAIRRAVKLETFEAIKGIVSHSRKLKTPIVGFPPGTTVFRNGSGQSLLEGFEIQFKESLQWKLDPEPPDPTIPQAGPDDDWVQMVDR
jgi:hypothetical protein